MNRVCTAIPTNRGLSLVELLVATALGVVLSFAALRVFLDVNRGYTEAQELARLQENGRLALRYLSYELAMAGYLATRPPGSRVIAGETGSACFDHLQRAAIAVEHLNDVSADGLGSGGGPDLPADCLLAGRHLSGSDLLLIRRTASAPTVFGGVRLGSLDGDALYLAASSPLAIPRVQRGGGVAGPDAQMWEYLPQILFLRNYSVSPGDEVPTLCRRRPARSSNGMAPTECLVEGIENLQLEFGIDDSGDGQADRFSAAPTALELQTAVAARIYLLVRSVRPLAARQAGGVYLMGATAVEIPADGYCRRLMQTTVVLRNNGGLRS